MSVTVNAAALGRKLTAAGRPVADQAVRKGTRQVFNRSQVLCPVDHGYLRASGSMDFRSTSAGPVGRVRYTANYAAAVNDGRRALVIKPRKKRFLKFTVGGQTVFAREVHQKARRAKPFLTGAAKEVALANGWVFRRV